MRAFEFFYEGKSEVKTGVKPHKDHEMTIPNAHRVAGTADRHYDLNRVMMLTATADGKHLPPFPPESWAGRNNLAFPYTPLEADMLKQVYQCLGYEWDDVLKPNPKKKSEEVKDVNSISPIATYKKNKYGI